MAEYDMESEMPPPDDYDMDALEEHIGYLVEDGIDLEDPEVAEYAADILQAQQESFFARKGASAKGTGIPPRRFGVTGSHSIEERRAKVAALKAHYLQKVWRGGPLERRQILPSLRQGGRQERPSTDWDTIYNVLYAFHEPFTDENPFVARSRLQAAHRRLPCSSAATFFGRW